MASTETTEQTEAEETKGGNASSSGYNTRKAAVRAAAIAAATGATAIAAKKAFSGRGSSSDDDDESKPARSDSASALTSVLTSGWDSARGSVVPMLEEAATHAGEYVAKNAPDIVSETLVPKFIRGFERAQKSSQDEE